MVTMIRSFEQPSKPPTDQGVAHQREFDQPSVTGIVPWQYVDQEHFKGKVPQSILLGCLRDGRLRVVSPIAVDLATEGDHVIAEAVDLNEFGFGENLSEALADLQRAVAELYFALESDHDRIGLDLLEVWSRLREKVQRRDYQGT